MSASRRRRRRVLFRLLVVVLVGLGGLEGALRLVCTRRNNGMLSFSRWPLLPYRPPAEAVRAWLQDAAAAEYVVPDPELGWTLAPSSGGRGLYTTNAQGFRARSDRVYPLEAPTDKLRLVACGDSFAHGDGLPLEQTWAWQLEQLDPRLEVVNLGVPAYGTDQAYLRWHRHLERGLRGQVAVLGVWPENICRNQNQVRYYLQMEGGYRPKPRFVLERGSLKLIPPPPTDTLPDLLSRGERTGPLAHERWLDPAEQQDSLLYASRVLRIAFSLKALLDRRDERQRYYDGVDPTGDALTAAIARRFADEATAAGERPLVLVFPMRDLLPGAGRQPLPLVQALRDAGLEVVDTFPPCLEVPDGWTGLFQSDGHLSESGNQVVADALRRALQRLGLLPE